MKKLSKNFANEVVRKVQEQPPSKLSIIQPAKVSSLVFKIVMILGVALVVFLFIQLGRYKLQDASIELFGLLIILCSCFSFILLFQKIKNR